jgi:hypothetical protein
MKSRSFVSDTEDVSDASDVCSKCPILVKEVAVIKDLQIKLMNKIDEFINTSKLMNRLEMVEKNVETIMRILVTGKVEKE